MKTNNPEVIVVHHEAGNQGFDGVNKMHKDKWNFESELGYFIGYQWYFDKNRGWIQGRAEDEEGAHTLGGWNRKAIGICFQGNYEFESFEYQEEFKKKIKDIRGRWGDLPIKMHGELWDTKCPGENLKEFIKSFRNQEPGTDPEIDKIKKQNSILWNLINQLFEVIRRLKEKYDKKSC